MKPVNQQSASPETRALPSIWLVLAPFGAAICAAVAAYEAFHYRPGLWWALGVAIFMGIGFLARNK